MKSIFITFIVIIWNNFTHLYLVSGITNSDIENCVFAVANRSFTPNKLLVVIIPGDDDLCISPCTKNNRYNESLRGFTNNIRNVLYEEEYKNLDKNILASHYSSIIWPVKVIQVSKLGSKNNGMISMPEKAKSYIMILKHEISRQIKQLDANIVASRNSSSWNPQAKWIIVSVTSSFQTKQQEKASTLDMLRKLLRSNIPNVVIIVAHVSNKHDKRSNQEGGDVEMPLFDIYSWCTKDYLATCNRTIAKVVIVNTWIKNGSDGYLQTQGGIFPNLDLRNLHGCPITVSVLAHPPFVMPPEEGNSSAIKGTIMKWDEKAPSRSVFSDGLEIRLLRNIAIRTNFTIVYRTTTKGDKITELINKTSDIALTNFIMPEDKLKFIDSTRPYLKEKGLWFVPARKPIPKWQSLRIIFRQEVWLCVITANLMGVASIWSLANIKFYREKHQVSYFVKEYDSFSKLGTVILNVISTLLGESVAKKPLTTPLRLFYLMWVFYCLEINTAYQSSLVSVLTHTFYEPKLVSFEDILYSGLKIKLSNVTSGIFNASGEPRYLEALRRHEPCKGRCIDEFAKDKNIAFVSGKFGTEYQIFTNYMRKGRPLLYDLEEEVISVDCYMVLKKGSVILPRFNKIITAVLEAGLMSKWWRDLRSSSIKYVDAKKADAKDGDDPNVLQMSHLQGTFSIWLFFLAISVLVFFIEMLTLLNTSLTDRGFFKKLSFKRNSNNLIKTRRVMQFNKHTLYRTMETIDKDKVKAWHL